METDEEGVVYAGVGSLSDLGGNKGLQAKGAVRDGKFLLLAGSIIAAAAPALSKKYVELRAVHLQQHHIEPSGGGCFRVVRDIAFNSASQAFIYAYGTNPPGGRQTWTPPGPNRTIRRPTPSSEKEAAQAVAAEDGAPHDDNEPRFHAVKDESEEEGEEEEEKVVHDYGDYDEEEEMSETEAELAYIEAKIRLLQIRKKKLLQTKQQQTGSSNKQPLARKLHL